MRKNARMSLHYHEWPAPAELAHLLQCAWRLVDDTPDGSVQTIYPDGRCELIAHRRTPLQRENGEGAWHSQAPRLFAAQQRVAIRLRANAPFDCVGLRLRPEASSWLVGSNLAACRDDILALDDLDASLALTFEAAANDAATREDAAPLWRWATETHSRFRVLPDVADCVRALDAAQGLLTTRALADQLRLPMRTLQQRFLRSVGLSIREYAQVIRLQTAIGLLDGKTTDLADMASGAGFADQPHASRALRAFTGLTPARLAAALRDAREQRGTIRMAAAFVRGARTGE